MINYSKESKKACIRFGLIDFIKKNKALIICISIIILISLLTGIFTAIKLYNLDNDIDLEDYSIYKLIDGSIYSFSSLILRILSIVIICLLIFVFTLNKYSSILAFLLIIYRTFLITVNCTFLIIKSGLSGLINSLIILPFQIINIIIISIFLIICIMKTKYKKECGYINYNHSKLLILLFVLSVLTCSAETIVLLIFKPTTILVV